VAIRTSSLTRMTSRPGQAWGSIGVILAVMGAGGFAALRLSSPSQAQFVSGVGVCESVCVCVCVCVSEGLQKSNWDDSRPPSCGIRRMSNAKPDVGSSLPSSSQWDRARFRLPAGGSVRERKKKEALCLLRCGP